MTSNLIDIIIPSWNNPQYLQPCLGALIHNRSTEGLFHIYVVNNGHESSCDWIESPFVTVIQAGGNKGWEGGLKLGLEQSKAPYVMFLNDDTQIPASSRLWLNQLLQHFRDEKVGAVGPSTNVVMGLQSIFAPTLIHVFPVKFLIGFCLLVRRSALDAVGGVDDTLPGGDDLDLSIRLRQGGYTLLADKTVFVYHHGFKTGERIHGTADKTMGWNSWEFKERTDEALIKKHGFRAWWDCMNGVWEYPTIPTPENGEWEDVEGKLVAERVVGERVLDLGCGSRKTVPQAIGLDMVKKDELIPTLTGQPESVADIEADVSQPLPIEPGTVDTIIARHILEHMMDPVSVLKNWVATLRDGGRLVIAVPDSSSILSIPMNIEHVHAWDPPAMRSLLETVGLTVAEQLDAHNGVSFITVAEKGVHEKT